MTIIDKELKRSVDAYLDLTTRMGRLLNLSRTCAVSDCRRERRCVGEGVPCMFEINERDWTVAREDLAEWKDLSARRRELARRYNRQRAASGTTLT